MTNFKELWDAWCNVWTLTDRTERDQKLQKFISDDFKYTDPIFQAKGLAQISDYIDQFQEQYPGTSFAPTNVLAHHERYLVKWDTLNDKNEIVDDGTSFALVENNRLKDITGFFKADNYDNL